MRASTLLATLAFMSAAALAQPAPDAQKSGEAPPADAGASRAAQTTDAPEQISTAAESTPAEAQLTNDRASHQQPAQLSTAAPSAQPPESLSRPVEGRTATVEPVTGADRCDPAIPKDKQSDLCRKVIESRADEYGRPAATELSPEQKLLLAQQWGTNAADALDAANRLARSGTPDNSSDALGVASIVLQQSQPPAPDDKKKDDNPATDATVQAIVQALTQAPPQN